MLKMNLTDSREEPISHNSINFRNSTQWSQVTPQYMPWGHTPTSPAAPLVTFTATSVQEQPVINTEPQPGPSNYNFSSFNILKHMKRKAEQDIASSITKQHITEEKMAAHMSRLHISSETPTETNVTNTNPENVEVRQQRLYVCEEMRKLQTESVLPSILLGRIERPCMAVMLWQPPPKVPDLLPPSLAAVINSANNNNNNNNNSEEDNNNSSSVDLNNMDMDT